MRLTAFENVICVQGDLIAQLNNRTASGVPAAPASGPKNRFCLVATSGVTWHTVPAQLPIAVIRQPGKMPLNKIMFNLARSLSSAICFKCNSKVCTCVQ